jgi:uncharacterized protein YdiU (UPF0061 family)
VDFANEALGGFEALFQGFWLTGMRAKLGLFNDEEDDAFLVHALLDWMRVKQMDFTNTFRALSDTAAMEAPPFEDEDFIQWHGAWKERLRRQPQSAADSARRMRFQNPAVIPRNHKVEEALATATEHGDLTVMQRLLAVLARPFESDHPEEFTTPPPPGSPAYQTFCGT